MTKAWVVCLYRKMKANSWLHCTWLQCQMHWWPHWRLLELQKQLVECSSVCQPAGRRLPNTDPCSEALLLLLLLAPRLLQYAQCMHTLSGSCRSK